MSAHLMRHGKSKYQFNRFTSWHRATLISTAKNLLAYQQIKTTKIKAKATKPLVEKLITLAKENTLAAKRHAYALLGDHKLVKILFNDIGPRFKNRPGGYTRTILTQRRRGDSAEMAILALTEIKKEAPRPKKTKEAKSGKEEKAVKPQDNKTQQGQMAPEQPKTELPKKERPPLEKKPHKKFFGGIKNIFKRERDSL